MEKFHQKPNLYVEQVSLKVLELDKAIQFYTEIIGFQVLEQTDQTAILTTDGKTGLLTLEQPQDVIPKEGKKSGLYHFAILLPTRADLSVFLRHIIETGYPLGASDHHVSEALYINDPDGHGIEIYIDRPSTAWKWADGMVHMVTDPIDGDGLLAETDAPWTGLPAGTIMGHVHLHVSDLKKAEEFYMKGLGFEIVSRYPQALFISTGDYHHHIALNTWQGVGAPKPPENMVGLNWYTVVFPDEETRSQTIERLREIGATVSEEDEIFVTEDPAGNQIHLVISNS
jgi:catechol 2,3-dioxygenase